RGHRGKVGSPGAGRRRALVGGGLRSGIVLGPAPGFGRRKLLSGRPLQTSSITQPPGPLLSTDTRATPTPQEVLCSNEGTCSRNSAVAGAEPSSRPSAGPPAWASAAGPAASPERGATPGRRPRPRCR